MITTHRRHRQIRVGAANQAMPILALLLVLGFVGGCGQPSRADVDRGDPQVTAAAFLRLYATHDPSACELVTTKLRTRFDRDGRCIGQPADGEPQLEVLDSRTCGDRHSFSAAVDPAGEVTTPDVTVGLQLVHGSWAVHSVLPLTDRSVIRPYECAAPSTEYVGGWPR